MFKGFILGRWTEVEIRKTGQGKQLSTLALSADFTNLVTLMKKIQCKEICSE